MRTPAALWRELRRRWAQASLEYDLEHGRRPYGRRSPDDAGRLPLEVPFAATIEAKVMRADGTVEDRGVIARRTLTDEQLARVRRAAERQRRRGKG